MSVTVTQAEVRDLLEEVNNAMPQCKLSQTAAKLGIKYPATRQLKVDYYSIGGGFMFYYTDETGKQRTLPSRHRLSTREAYRFLQGILFSINYLLDQ